MNGTRNRAIGWLVFQLALVAIPRESLAAPRHEWRVVEFAMDGVINEVDLGAMVTVGSYRETWLRVTPPKPVLSPKGQRMGSYLILQATDCKFKTNAIVRVLAMSGPQGSGIEIEEVPSGKRSTQTRPLPASIDEAVVDVVCREP